MDPKAKGGVLRRHRREDRGEGHVKVEAEIGVKELPGASPEAVTGKGGFCPEAFGGSVVLQHLDFGLPATRTVRE